MLLVIDVTGDHCIDSLYDKAVAPINQSGHGLVFRLQVVKTVKW